MEHRCTIWCGLRPMLTTIMGMFSLFPAIAYLETKSVWAIVLFLVMLATSVVSLFCNPNCPNIDD